MDVAGITRSLRTSLENAIPHLKRGRDSQTQDSDELRDIIAHRAAAARVAFLHDALRDAGDASALPMRAEDARPRVTATPALPPNASANGAAAADLTLANTPPPALVAAASGNAAPPTSSEFYAAARDAYLLTNPPPAEGPWTLLRYTPTLKVYRRGAALLVAIRGTKQVADAAANAALVTNRLVTSARYKTDLACIEGIIRAYPGPPYGPFVYYLTGHSLGGAIAQQFARDLPACVPRPGFALLFNSANQPQDLLLPIPGISFLYNAKDQILALTRPFWNLGGPRSPPTIVDTGASGLAAHSIRCFATVFPDAPEPGVQPPANSTPPVFSAPGGVTAPITMLGRRFIVPPSVPTAVPGAKGSETSSAPPGSPPDVDGEEVAVLSAPAPFEAALRTAQATLTQQGLLHTLGALTSATGAPTLIETAFQAHMAVTDPRRAINELFGGSAASVAAARGHSLTSQAEVALSDGDIKTMVPGIRVLTYPEMAAAPSMDALMGRDDAVVILFLTESHTSGHWTAVLRHTSNTGMKRLEYFDPYGGPPDAPMEWLTPARRKALGETSRVLTRLLRDAPELVDINRARLQEQADDVNTCGRHVVVRLWHRSQRLPQYVPWLMQRARTDNCTPDDVVTRATAHSLAHLHALKKDAT